MEPCWALAKKNRKGLDVKQFTVSRLIKQVAKTGSATSQWKRKCGRKRKTSSRDDIFVMRQSKLDPRKNSLDLQRDVALTGTEISASEMRKRLIMGWRKYIRPVKKQLLTDMKTKCMGKRNTKAGLQITGRTSCLLIKVTFL